MKLGIVYSKASKEVIQDINSVFAEIYSFNVQVFVLKKLENVVFFKNIKFLSNFENIVRECDIVVSFGGDGTVIEFAKLAACFGKPLVGVNSGCLGFLASLDRNQISEIKKIINGDFKVVCKTILEINGLPKPKILALNDLVVSRGMGSHISYYSVYQGSSRVCCHCADGIILAAPSGSTAYSFSAGGPIIDPDLKCVAITPICPHSLNSRSYVVGIEVPLEIEYRPKKGSKVHVYVDGRACFSCVNRGRITVSQSKLKARIISLPDTDFYKTVDRKLINKTYS